jgi:hypothetical protein
MPPNRVIRKATFAPDLGEAKAESKSDAAENASNLTVKPRLNMARPMARADATRPAADRIFPQ